MSGGRTIKLVDAGEHLLDDFPTRFGEKTRALYRPIWRHCQEKFPDKRIGEFTEHDLVAFVSGLTVDDLPPSPNTIAARIKALRQLFKWAQWKGIRKDDPTIMLKELVGVKIHNVSTGVWLSEGQMSAAVAATSGHDPRSVRDRLVLRFGVQRGLRAGEMCGLTWSGIDFAGRTVSGIGKGSKPFTSKLPSQLVEDLFLWRSLYVTGVGHDLADEPVLVSVRDIWVPGRPMDGSRQVTIRWGRRLTPNGIHSIVGRLGARIGVTDLDPHDLRRSFAGWLEAKGRPYLEIARELRHENVATTVRYLEGNPHKPEADLDDLAL